jgi:NADP-dependent 3-hydroxy acid dehydrogenase YdfG
LTQSLAGRVVIVTGASSGIGAATARLLHEAGALPVLAARRSGRLEALSRQLDGALALSTDVKDRNQVGALAQATIDRYGRLDALVNKAGASYHVLGEEIDPVGYLELLKLNMVGVVNGIQAVLPHMRASGGGHVVNTSSGSTLAACPGVGAYSATKCAVNMLSQAARLELAADNIRVTLVLPSITSTESRGGMYTDSATIQWHGLVPHSPEYAGRVILRALRTGEARVDIPHGPEQPDFAAAC